MWSRPMVRSSRGDTPTGARTGLASRERQIAEVLVRYGLSYLANVVGLERVVSAADGLVGRARADPRTPSENLRLALEELGPTFIKLGSCSPHEPTCSRRTTGRS